MLWNVVNPPKNLPAVIFSPSKPLSESVFMHVHAHVLINKGKKLNPKKKIERKSDRVRS